MQAVASAPLWDEEQGMVIGMISASDFIHVLRRLRHRYASVSHAVHDTSGAPLGGPNFATNFLLAKDCAKPGSLKLCSIACGPIGQVQLPGWMFARYSG